MREMEFNLLDAPWIRVMTQDCRTSEVSLADALLGAHTYRDLAGEMPAQDLAVLRLLAALAHTVLTRFWEESEDFLDPGAWRAPWRELWRRGRFPEELFRAYFARWHDRFWLFHPERPFYQVPSAKDGTAAGVAKLNGMVSEGENKIRLFSMLAAQGKAAMSFPEAARWLVFLNGFDDCAAKQKDKSAGSRPMSPGWLGRLGLVMAVGENLFETILLNMPMLIQGREPWEEADLPVWEQDTVCGEERRTIAMPQNLAELYTLQSRRILLKRAGDRVVGYTLLGGDAFEDTNALNEPMTLWNRIEDKKEKTFVFRPRRHERSKKIWREFGSMVESGDAAQRPGVVSWVDALRQLHLLDRRTVSFRTVAARYDASMSSSITDTFSDSLAFHADLLNDAGRLWRTAICEQIQRVEDAALAVGKLATNLGRAAGQGEKEIKPLALPAREAFFAAVDGPFREWLGRLNPAQDSEERQSLLLEWERLVRRMALALGRQMVEEKGDTAFVGRTVKIKEKEFHYSSPEAFGWFRRELFGIYQNIAEKEGKKVGN